MTAATARIEGQACLACGDPLRSDNQSGICGLCQRAKVSNRRCASGCGALLDVRNDSGLCRTCYPRALAAAARELIHREVQTTDLSACLHPPAPHEDEGRNVTD